MQSAAASGMPLRMQCIVERANLHFDPDSLALQKIEACQSSAYKVSKQEWSPYIQPGIGCSNRKQWAEQFPFHWSDTYVGDHRTHLVLLESV